MAITEISGSFRIVKQSMNWHCSSVVLAAFILLVSFGIKWIVLPSIPSTSPQTIRRLYERSLRLNSKFENSTHLFLQEARLKPATNSYVDAKFPNVKEQSSSVHLENATILMLCRNWELPGVLKSMRALEDRFNRDYHYPWVFLNDANFTSEFITET